MNWWKHQPLTENNFQSVISSILLLVLRVTPFKIDQNKNQNYSIVKVQNLENERK